MDWKLIVGSTVLAALVSAVVAFVTSKQKIASDRDAIERRIKVDVDMAMQRLEADRNKLMSDKAWADYELRRDAYVDIARQIDCLFAEGDATGRLELHRTARRVRLVGCDGVVRSMNALFAAIREGLSSDVLETRYRCFFNAMRHDIRQVHAMPAEGTDLTEDAFPIET